MLGFDAVVVKMRWVEHAAGNVVLHARIDIFEHRDGGTITLPESEMRAGGIPASRQIVSSAHHHNCFGATHSGSAA